MKVNEVEELLGITRANIRFYEKEGLIFPKRKDNGYRDYSENDISEIKKIIVLRKIGISIPDIKRIFNNEIALSEAVRKNISDLEAQIETLKGALAVSQEIADNNTEISLFDENYYFNVIENEENSGNGFNNILSDVVGYEENIFAYVFKFISGFNYDKIKKKHGAAKALVIFAAICIIRGLSKKFIWHESFFEGFIYPIVLLFWVSLILLPIFFISKKHPKVAKVICEIIFTVGILFLALCIGALIVGLILALIEKIRTG